MSVTNVAEGEDLIAGAVPPRPPSSHCRAPIVASPPRSPPPRRATPLYYRIRHFRAAAVAAFSLRPAVPVPLAVLSP